MLAPGTLLQNRYEIVRLIAEGGMGAVYLARDQRLDSEVALKETLFTDQRMSKAFEREARLLARLRHPALPRVSDHFIEENGQFLIMEYIPGEDLAQMLKRRTAPFPSDDVMRWADQLLDALDYLHSQELPVVHRDIKPQNLKLNERGQIILLDFGLAKNSPLQMTRVTSSGSIYGFTSNYAPMEQIQGVGTDPRSDLYSLGATLYHFVTGATPQDALTRAAAVVDGQSDPLRAASELNGQVSSAVGGVIQKALALSRNQRHVSAAEMRSAMHAACNAASDSAFQKTAVIGTPRRGIIPKGELGDVPTLPAQPQVEKKDRLSANSPSHDATLVGAEVTVETAEPEAPVEKTALRVEGVSDPKVQALVSAGASAFDSRQYAMALGHWEAALKLSPDEPGIKESIENARRLIRKEDGRRAQVGRLVADGTEAFDAKQYEFAIEKWNEALMLSPNEPGVEATVKAARTAMDKEAERKVRVKQQVKVKLLVAQGAQAFDDGKYELAIQRWTEVLNLSPNEPGMKRSIEAASQKLTDLATKIGENPEPERQSHDQHRKGGKAPGLEGQPTILHDNRRGSHPAIWTIVIGFALLAFILYVVLPTPPALPGVSQNSNEQQIEAASSLQTDPIVVEVQAGVRDVVVSYMIDNQTYPSAFVLEKGRSRVLPTAQGHVELYISDPRGVRMTLNGRKATLPEAIVKDGRATISRENIQTFLQ